MAETIRQARIAAGRGGPGKLLVRYAARSRSPQPGDPPTVHRTRALILIALALALRASRFPPAAAAGTTAARTRSRSSRTPSTTTQSIDSGSLRSQPRRHRRGRSGRQFRGAASAGPSRARRRRSRSSTSTPRSSSTRALRTSPDRRPHLDRRGRLRQLPGHRLRGAPGALRPVLHHLQQLQQQSESQGDQGNLLQSLGIDPTNWLTDLSNEGTEDVEGTETIHISGQADVPKLVEDIKKIAENAPKAGQQVTPEQLGQLDQLTAIIKIGRLRHLQRRERQPAPQARGEPRARRPRRAPRGRPTRHPRVLAHAQRRQRAADDLGARPAPSRWRTSSSSSGSTPAQLGGALRGGLGAGGALPQAGGSPAAPSGGASQAYLECLQQAQGAGGRQQCAQLLQ